MAGPEDIEGCVLRSAASLCRDEEGELPQSVAAGFELCPPAGLEDQADAADMADAQAAGVVENGGR